MDGWFRGYFMVIRRDPTSFRRKNRDLSIQRYQIAAESI
jgi:hypothetical protein